MPATGHPGETGAPACHVMESWRDSWESGSLVRYLLLSSIVHQIKKRFARKQLKVLFTADLQVSLYFKGVFTNIGPGRLGWAGVGTAFCHLCHISCNIRN